MTLNQYEAMFVFDPTFGSLFENCETEIRRLMDRASGEVVLCRKWDDRRLAYKIRGRKRGIYALTYFKAPADRIAPMERDAKLSEHILRLLVLRADGLRREDMEKVFPSRTEEGGRGGDDEPAKASAEPKPGRTRKAVKAADEKTEPVAADSVSTSEDEPPVDA